MLLSMMLIITGLLLFFLAWCPLLVFLVYLLPIGRLQRYIEQNVDSYTDSIGFGIGLSCVLAFVLGWVVAIVNLVS